MTLNIVIIVIIICFICVNQSNDASPKIGSPNRDKSW